MAEPRRLLVTSVGSLVGHNLLEGLAGRREGLVVVGLNSEPDAVSNFLCDRVHLTPPLAAPGFEAHFEALVAREAPQLIVPGRDDDVVFLADWLAQPGHAAWRGMVGAASAARLMRDKRLSAEFAQAAGLPFAPTRVAEDGAEAVQALARAWGWPLLAKPRLGQASKGVVLVADARQLEVALTWPGYCFQPWLGGAPALGALREALAGGFPLDWSLPGNEKTSLDGCVAPGGELLALCATQHSELRLGRSERVVLLPEGGEAHVLARAFGTALAQAGWRGPFNVQLGRNAAGELTAFELNGRFTGSAATLALLGLDFIGLSLGAFIGPLPPLPPRPAGLTAQRVDKRLANWALPDGAVAHLRSSGHWPGP